MKNLIKVLVFVGMLIAMPFAGSASAMVSYDYTINFDTGTKYAPVGDFYKAETGVEFGSGWIFAGGQNGYALGTPQTQTSPTIDASISFAKPASEVRFDFTGYVGSISVFDADNETPYSLLNVSSWISPLSMVFSALDLGITSIVRIDFIGTYMPTVDNLAFNASPTPIPGTLLMLISGMLGLVGVRRFS